MKKIKLPINVYSTCRTCLSQNSDMIPIFSELHNRRLDLKLNDIAQFEIVCDDGLPPQICSVCAKLIDETFTFKQQIKTVDEILRNYSNEADDSNSEDNINNSDKAPDDTMSVASLHIEFAESLLQRIDRDIKENSTPVIQNIVPFKCVPLLLPIQEFNKNKILKKNDSEETMKPPNPVGIDISKCIECPICHTKFVSDLIYLQHMKSVHRISNQFLCNYCGSAYTKKCSLEIHIQSQHTLDKKKKCNKCFNYFGNDEEYNEHRIKHELNFSCTICEKEFSFRQSLKTHMRLHRRAGKCECNQCHLLFLDDYQLRRHIKVAHTGEIHECPHCKKIFTHKTRLHRHLLSHMEKNDRPLKCQYCPKKFNHIHHLQNHERIHTGAKPYLCSKCGKGFSQSYHLTLHSKQHDNLSNIICEICNKEFTFMHNLKRHMITHSGEKPFMCNVCGKCYNDQTTLKKHLTNHKRNQDYDSKSDVEDPD